ncbi:hypothetical protein DL98DRAFT_575407 [Cadophora sp. DSE1049]|nr:hypothetical protein DL98DRAFT_575407 [Cadophora sp. DSE1049]
MDSATSSRNARQSHPAPQQHDGGIQVDEVVASSSAISPLEPCGPYSLLLAELPDLFQDLFLQRTLDSFNSFSQLPLEIRLSVWRFSFPRGRLINLDQYVAASFEWDADRDRTYGIETSCGLPPTLHVNQESRRETLKHYSLVFRIDRELNWITPKTRVRPLCYNPKLDTMFFTDSYIMHDPSWNWLHRIQQASPVIFNSIEVFEIRNWHWCLSLDWEIACSLNPEGLSDELAFFFKFPALKSLKIVLSKGASDDIPYFGIQLDKKADLIQGMEMMFQKYAPRRTVIPKVTVESWDKLLSRVS